MSQLESREESFSKPAIPKLELNVQPNEETPQGGATAPLGSASRNNTSHRSASVMSDAINSARSSISFMDDEELQQELQRIHDTKIRLENEMKFAEKEQRYADAARLKDKLKKLNILEAQRVEKRVKCEIEKKRKEFESRAQLEIEAFENTWVQKLAEYDQQAKDIVLQTVERQKWENKEAIEQLKAQSVAKKPKFSTKVLEMRALLERFVHAQSYLEAEQTKQKIQQMEIAEMEKFEKEQVGAIEQRMKSVLIRQKQEVEALKMRIKQGRNELIQQRQREWKRLQQHHENLKNELEQRAKKLQTKTAEQVARTHTVLAAPAHKGNISTFSLEQLITKTS